MQKKSLTVYLVFAFALAWALWLATAALSGTDSPAFSAAKTLGMYAPLIAAAVAARGLSVRKAGISWQPHIRGNVFWYLSALILPTVLTVLGGAVYYFIFPSHFDRSLQILSALLQGSEISVRQYILMVLVQSMTAAPLINAVFALGEEAGWRGYMYPRLRERFGQRRALLLGGAIWGLWHAPIIVLGHNYGTGYWGYPVTGIAAMCVFCICAGILLSFLYEKTNSIWPCALAHGALNAVAALPQYVLSPDAPITPLLGPAGAVGLLSGLPVTLLAAAVFFCWQKNERRQHG